MKVKKAVSGGGPHGTGAYPGVFILVFLSETSIENGIIQPTNLFLAWLTSSTASQDCVTCWFNGSEGDTLTVELRMGTNQRLLAVHRGDPQRLLRNDTRALHARWPCARSPPCIIILQGARLWHHRATPRHTH